MLLLLASIVVLIIFFSFFITIKINRNPNVKFIDSSSQNITEESVPNSSADAIYNEMRYDFLRFAEFFLLVRRPYGIKDDLPWNENIDYKGTTNGVSDIGGIITNSTVINCKNNCKNDTNCNLWKYDNDEQKCTKYNIGATENVTIDNNNEGTTDIGYWFRARDTSWAVDDLSELPNKKELFQKISEMVIKLKSKNQELLKKAKSILSSLNVKYCYEESISKSQQILNQYMSDKQLATQYLEKSALYFIFKRFNYNDTYKNKIEFRLLVSKIVYLYMNDDNNETQLFNDIVDSATKIAVIEYIDELQEHYMNYNIVKSWFTTKLDTNSDGYITRQELINIYNNAYSKINNSEQDTTFPFDFTVDTDSCNNDVEDKVNLFFSTYDSNGTGRVYLDDILSSVPEPPNLNLQSC